MRRHHHRHVHAQFQPRRRQHRRLRGGARRRRGGRGGRFHPAGRHRARQPRRSGRAVGDRHLVLRGVVGGCARIGPARRRPGTPCPDQGGRARRHRRRAVRGQRYLCGPRGTGARLGESRLPVGGTGAAGGRRSGGPGGAPGNCARHGGKGGVAPDLDRARVRVGPPGQGGRPGRACIGGTRPSLHGARR